MGFSSSVTPSRIGPTLLKLVFSSCNASSPALLKSPMVEDLFRDDMSFFHFENNEFERDQSIILKEYLLNCELPTYLSFSHH